MTSPTPNFQDYQQALERLRRRALQRRAVMTSGVNTSFEMPILDEQEIQDRELCQRWQDLHGFFPEAF